MLVSLTLVVLRFMMIVVLIVLSGLDSFVDFRKDMRFVLLSARPKSFNICLFLANYCYLP